MTSTHNSQLPSAAALEALLHQHIPASQLLDIHVAALDRHSIRMTAPVEEPNVNIHGTGFAGSIYTVSTLAAWGLVMSGLRQVGSQADLVMKTANIRYLKPVLDRINAECSIDKNEGERFFGELALQGKSTIDVTVDVVSDGVVCAEFNACLVAINKKR